MATILLANADHRFNQALIKVLTAYHHDVLTARTGEEALQLFDTHHPTLVLLDLALLGMSGLDTLGKIRARTPHLPVIILTGETRIEVEDRAREMGVTDVLRKRLKMDVIMHAIHRALQQVGQPTTPLLASLATTTPATILIVDDDQEIRELVQEFLARRQYHVKTAANGEEALTVVTHEPPDLILLDIYMPGMNGVEVLRRLVASGFPGGVIMLTASQEEPLLNTALGLGAFDVLSKPVDLDQVELAVMVKLAMQD